MTVNVVDLKIATPASTGGMATIPFTSDTGENTISWNLGDVGSKAT